MSAEQPPTWIASLTPPGRAAIATLGLYGPRAWEVVRQHFHSPSGKSLPERLPAGQFRLGRLGADSDEVVLAVKQLEPVPRLELHSHGGREVTHWLLDFFQANGLQVCSWQQYLQHTEPSPLRASAAGALSSATTTRTAAILLDQYQGALERALTEVIAVLERGETETARGRLDELVRWAPLGRHLTLPWRVVVAGAPNVGKSSLVNALAGYQRSVVAATPGTTRDVVTTSLAIDGWPVELADTAGLRNQAGLLEEQGIQLARTWAAGADLCLWVLDVAAPPVWPDVAAGQLQVVLNKMDLAPVWDLAQASGGLRVSAQTGAGLAELCAALGRWLVPESPPPGAAVPFTEPVCAGVEEARRRLAAGQTADCQRVLEALRTARPT